MLGLMIMCALVLCSVFAPYLAPANPNSISLRLTLQPPSAGAPLGRDELGRDILSRLIYGSRTSFGIAVAATGIGLVFGVLLGLIAGYFGGLLDGVVMRAVDFVLAFPSFLVAMVVVGTLGPGLANVVIAVGIVFIPRFVRLMRATVLAVCQADYVEAVQALGLRSGRIILKHVLPNSVGTTVALAAILSAEAVLITSGLGFLGLGAQPPHAEWGAMLSEGRVYLATAPHVSAFPGIAIMIMVVALNLIGDGLRDALDAELG